jgi:hypothetical protein
LLLSIDSISSSMARRHDWCCSASTNVAGSSAICRWSVVVTWRAGSPGSTAGLRMLSMLRYRGLTSSASRYSYASGGDETNSGCGEGVTVGAGIPGGGDATGAGVTNDGASVSSLGSGAPGSSDPSYRAWYSTTRSLLSLVCSSQLQDAHSSKTASRETTARRVAGS